MSSVYDWIGSLALRPENFELRDYQGRLVLPGSDITSGVYNVKECEEPINMTAGGTVAFHGFGTAPILNVSSSSDSSDIKNRHSSENTLDIHYQKLNDYRLKYASDIGKNEIYLVVHRDNIYNNMILYYSDDNFDMKVVIIFFEEEADGDGVTRDAYTLFFKVLYEKFERYERVPVATLDATELIAIGRIITSSFVFYNVFPFQICKAALKHILFGAANDEELLQSFMSYLPSWEMNLITFYVVIYLLLPKKT